MTSPVRFPANLKPLEPQGSFRLEQERKRASFDAKKLSEIIYGPEYLARQEKLLAILQSDPILGDKSHRFYSGRDVRFQKGLAAAKRLAELSNEHQWGPEEWRMVDQLFDEAGPFRLHRAMFIPTLQNQGTEEQKRLFMEPAQRYEIIGCYAQTELGHGSNIQGLETTATYDIGSKSFVLHSPTLTASKWWIGGLGVAATHAIIMARLIINGQDYGPHPFVVQIRDLQDHKPLPGVTVGDIGPKFGLNTIDNGFVVFDHVRIPHIAMLAKYSRVDPDSGRYIKPPNSKLAYGTMVYVRANIVLESRYVLARAATVAIRYSAVRAQGNPSKGVETPVLDYSMQQYRLLPIVAQAYACHFTGQAMHRLYHENQTRMNTGDFSALVELHATSSGLKSLTTTLALAAIEECRRACGGHGYSLFSGLGQFYQDYLPKVTWEGDNYLLTQQTTRFLLKMFRSTAAGSGTDQPTNFSAGYIREYLNHPSATCAIESASDISLDALLAAFKFRAAYLVEQAVHAIDKEKRSWNDMLVDIYRISRAHCQLVMLSNFDTSVAIFSRLALLFGLATLEQELADFLTIGYLSAAQAKLIRQQTLVTIKQLRPDAVALVDAFAIPEFALQSALGDAEGRVYERLIAMAEREPLNKHNVAEGYNSYIRPLVHAGKHNWKRGGDGRARL
ncbi:hypothetical protein EC973_006050 [Apophysomyces ossiformis]|uniref:Acyl-coenzyme A oxidase n=1 Tax=Apophysomyces ossiformis TaxID=679940 RepID=A0A8H7EQQ5_9FUNG|nr:hypothetical protein EC973_006050 [Apophysomyces ossiformis]